MTPEIANRIIKNRYHFSSFTQFVHKTKSRDITYNTHEPDPSDLILQMTQTDVKQYKETDYNPLPANPRFPQRCFRPALRLKKICKSTRHFQTSFALRTLDGTANQMLKQDIFSSELYEQQKTGKRKIVFLS